jgi:hypothetical protein
VSRGAVASAAADTGVTTGSGAAAGSTGSSSSGWADIIAFCAMIVSRGTAPQLFTGCTAPPVNT